MTVLYHVRIHPLQGQDVEWLHKMQVQAYQANSRSGKTTVSQGRQRPGPETEQYCEKVASHNTNIRWLEDPTAEQRTSQKKPK